MLTSLKLLPHFSAFWFVFAIFHFSFFIIIIIITIIISVYYYSLLFIPFCLLLIIIKKRSVVSPFFLLIVFSYSLCVGNKKAEKYYFFLFLRNVCSISISIYISFHTYTHTRVETSRLVREFHDTGDHITFLFSVCFFPPPFFYFEQQQHHRLVLRSLMPDKDQPSSSSPAADASSRHDRARMHFGSLNDVEGTSHHFKHLQPSVLRPFFGANVPEPTLATQPQGNEHPCAGYSRQVHRCLDHHNNDFTFCQSSVSAFNQCLNEMGSK